ncbi:MAG TPA: hypothetical protein VF396_17175, partial [Bradyrhizobium sp.]
MRTKENAQELNVESPSGKSGLESKVGTIECRTAASNKLNREQRAGLDVDQYKLRAIHRADERPA